MVFFALCGSWVLRYLQIGEPAFKIASGVILFLVAWEMLTSKRMRLIGIVRTISSFAFCFALSAMIATYLDAHGVSSWLFFCSIILMVMAMLGFTIELQIVNSALDVHISDLEDHHEWHHLIAPKRRRRASKKAAKNAVQQAAETYEGKASSFIGLRSRKPNRWSV